MLKLFLPILFPSWRFFSGIGPSPRIYYSFLENETDEPTQWFEFRPKPLSIPLGERLFRFLHNPKWNEKLYINTCAERLFEGYSEMCEQEIMRRILAAVHANEIQTNLNDRYLVYRISAVMREGEQVNEQTTFVAMPILIKGTDA